MRPIGSAIPRQLMTLVTASFMLFVFGCSEDGHGTGESVVDPAVLARYPSLDRVARAMSGPFHADESGSDEHIESVAVWIRENRPTFNDREIRYFANLIGMTDEPGAGPSTIRGVQHVTDLDYLMLWLLDRDGDVTLREPEALRLLGIAEEVPSLLISIDPTHWDPDGDGVMSDEHRQALVEANGSAWDRVLDQLVERVRRARWDFDGAGTLSDEEIRTGERMVGYPDLDRDGEISEQERELGMPLVIEDLVRCLGLIKVPSMEALQRVTVEEMARTGGDMEQAGKGVMVRVMQAQFKAVAGEIDTDGNGLLTDDEWADGYDRLRRARDLRAFLYLYDHEQSGSISSVGINRFMDAYDTESLHADADLNGLVDQADLAYFVEMVSNL